MQSDHARQTLTKLEAAEVVRKNLEKNIGSE